MQFQIFVNMSIQREFGLKVKELFLEKDLSQVKLAELTNLHRTYISSIELSKRNISFKNISKNNNCIRLQNKRIISPKLKLWQKIHPTRQEGLWNLLLLTNYYKNFLIF